MRKKNYIIPFLIVCLSFTSCILPSLFESTVTITFEHYWDDQKIQFSDIGETAFVTENGEQIVIDSLRYIVSQIELKRENRNTIHVLGDRKIINLRGGVGRGVHACMRGIFT